MQAPAEKLAYVAALNPPGRKLNDAMLVVDVDPTSANYASLCVETALSAGTMREPKRFAYARVNSAPKKTICDE